MSKKVKYIICALFGVAVLAVIFFLVLGGKKKEFLITFDSSGGSNVESQTVIEGEKIIKPTNPVKENSEFVRWEYQNREYNFSNEVTSDMTLNAVWEAKIEVKYYDVEFTVDGVTKKLSLSEITEDDLEGLGFPEKEGYEIKWYVGDAEYDFSKPLTDNVSLVGKYEKITTYTVKFNSDGGPSVSSQKVKPNEKATEPEAITRYGYVFEGWYLNNEVYDFSTPVTSNITLKAKWSEDPNVKRYEVTFDSDGGSKVSKQRVIENEKATEPKNPTKDGYKFLGWYLGDNKYDFKTKVTKKITLKAKWEEIIKYTVTFNKNNGSANETKQVISGEKVKKPSDPTKTGYKFLNWLYDNKEFDFNTAITQDITLTANYKALAQYTVTFDSNGGSAVASQKVYEGETVSKPANPTKTDNDFVEWQLNGSKYDFKTKVTSDITLKAKWEEKASTYKVYITRVDNYSTDSYLKVKKDNQEISFNKIQCNGKTISEKLSDGSVVANNGEIDKCGTSFTVVLTNGSSVRATKG